MNSVVGEILPLAVGVAISPIPVITAILMLLSPKARSTSVGFLLGWVVGIVAAVTVFTALSSVVPDPGPDGPKLAQGAIQLVLGAVLVLLAVRQWRSRPKRGAEPAMPKWMQAVDKAGFGTALGLGVLLSAVNPKNLLLAVAAGGAIGSAGLTGGGVAGAIAIYSLLAASTVLLPVVGYAIAAEKLRAPLDALRVWLGRESSVIMAVLLLVLGVDLLGKGIGSF